MKKSDFWFNRKKSEKIIKEFNDIKELVQNFQHLEEILSLNLELGELLKVDYDNELKKDLESQIEGLSKNLSVLETTLLLNGPYDNDNVIFEIHSGAGGTEANDWAAMLYRMYLRFFEKKGYKVEVIEEQKGDEVGFKTISLIVKGSKAYGYLKNEIGVHRLVRISPFDANSRRHTSFASVEVIPFFNEKIEVEIKETDLVFDVYKSSGAGGQSVNTTDSAVRITHLPTKTVVTCQNERSQIQNREKALEILKNKLYKLELEKQEIALKKIKGEGKAINFGSQIRSYILHPYLMVKDHRTNVESSNPSRVLDGDLDSFIEASLKNK